VSGGKLYGNREARISGRGKPLKEYNLTCISSGKDDLRLRVLLGPKRHLSPTKGRNYKEKEHLRLEMPGLRTLFPQIPVPANGIPSCFLLSEGTLCFPGGPWVRNVHLFL